MIRAVMQTHVEVGANVLAGSQSALLQLAEQIATLHHERWDGTGYPAGLAGEAIPLAGRIVAVADVFDALTHERPYKQAWPVDRAVAEVVASSGTHFDPSLVVAFDPRPRRARRAAPGQRAGAVLPHGRRRRCGRHCNATPDAFPARPRSAGRLILDAGPIRRVAFAAHVRFLHLVSM